MRLYRCQYEGTKDAICCSTMLGCEISRASFRTTVIGRLRSDDTRRPESDHCQPGRGCVMSHIISFKIEGLAGRQGTLELELNRDTNIIFGQNGCGKTSLLKILHAAMANRTDILARVPFTSAEVQIYSRDWKKVFTRSVKKPGNTTPGRSKEGEVIRRRLSAGDEVVLVEEPGSVEGLKWSIKPSSPKEAATVRWAHEYLPTSRLHVDDRRITHALDPSWSRRTRLTEDQLDLFFARSLEYLWREYSTTVLVAVRSAQEQGLASILRAVLSPTGADHRCGGTDLTSEMAYDRVRKFLARQGSASILGTRAAFDKRYAAEATLQDVVHDIDVVERSIDDAMASRTSLQDLISRLFTANKEVRFTDESIEVLTPSGGKIGLSSLSSGEKHLLRILVQALLVNENSLMIDEPEISMHVDWQKMLIQSMQALNADAQLILATHSPEIMANVADDRIFRI